MKYIKRMFLGFEFTHLYILHVHYFSLLQPNGYQSLHTALMYKGQSVEVQIRTSYMHQVAEYGMASHFAYKDEMKRSNNGMAVAGLYNTCLLYTSPSPRDGLLSRMPSSA